MKKSVWMRSSQGGFSMVEMLMAAFIMAIGLLGLAMLQTLTLRTNTGSRSLSTAILVGESLLDDIQANGRASKLFVRQGSSVPAAILASFANRALTYNLAGRRVSPTDAPPDADPTPYFTVNVGVETTGANAVAPVPTMGGLANFTVTTVWTEGTGAAGTPVQRRVVLTRRIGYAIN